MLALATTLTKATFALNSIELCLNLTFAVGFDDSYKSLDFVIRNLVLRRIKLGSEICESKLSIPLYGIWSWDSCVTAWVTNQTQLSIPLYGIWSWDEELASVYIWKELTFNSVIRNLVLRQHEQEAKDTASIPFNSVIRNLVLRPTNFLPGSQHTQAFNSVIRNLVLRPKSNYAAGTISLNFQFRYTEFGLETHVCTRAR